MRDGKDGGVRDGVRDGRNDGVRDGRNDGVRDTEGDGVRDGKTSVSKVPLALRRLRTYIRPGRERSIAPSTTLRSGTQLGGDDE